MSEFQDIISPFNNVFIISTLLVFLSVLVTKIKNPLLQCICVKSMRELDLEVEVSELQRELSLFYCREDFVRHSRLSRRLAVLQRELDLEIRKRRGSYTWQTYVVSAICETIGAIILIVTVALYMHDPIVVMPTEWLFPLNVILAWPTGVDGSISALLWIVLLRAILHMWK